MSELLYNMVNSQSFWIFSIVWIFVCIAWVERWKPPLYRIEKIISKPIIFKRDPDSKNIPFYPRSFMEDSAHGFRDTLREPFINLIKIISDWLSNLSIVLHSKNYFFRILIYIVLLIGWLVVGVLYIVDYALKILGTLIPFAFDITYRLVYALVDSLQWLITTPIQAILSPFHRISESFTGSSDDYTTRKKEDDLRRKQEIEEETHRLNILRNRFSSFANILSELGVNPKIALMMMSGDNWRQFFERYEQLEKISGNFREDQLRMIHKQINDLIADEQLSEGNIQKLLNILEDESHALGTRPSILKQFELFLETSDQRNQVENLPKLGESSKDNKNPEEGLKNKKFRVSLTHPKLLSKRFESTFLFQVYTPDNRSQVTRNIKAEFHEEVINEHTKQSMIMFGQRIKVKLFSPVFDFPESVTKLIDNPVNKITFLGIPKDDCEPGHHKVLISISDAKTDQEFESFTISLRVVDFAFDHVSRPILSRISAIVLGVGSFAMFILTSLEQIDKTIGLTSGTAAGVLALGIYASFYNLYQRVRPNTP